MINDDRSAYDRLVESIQYLAGVCDGASTWDGHGFNKFDAEFGHSLAYQSQNRQLSKAQQLAGLKMVTKYRGQLEKVEMELPTRDEILAELSDEPAAPIGRIELQGDVIAVSFRYDKELVNQVKLIGKGDGCRGAGKWDKDSKHWRFPLTDEIFDEILETFPKFEVDQRIKERVAIANEEAEIEAMQREAEKKALFDAIGDLSKPQGLTGIHLYQHQQEGVKFLLNAGSAILADDMGTGKSFTALKAASAYSMPIFVICPASLKTNWEREAAKMGVVIETYSWAKIPLPLENQEYIVIADESHMAQNLRSQRTQKFLNLAHNAKAVYALTGTPIKNGRPANLFPLLVAIKHPLGDDRRAYEKRYCNAGPTRWSRWDNSGAAHLDELHEKLSDGMLRRTKKDCLDLPEKTRILKEVQPDDEAMAQFEAKFSQLQSEYERRKEAGEIQDGGEVLVMLNHLRHSASIAKISETLAVAEEIIEQGNQVVIFTCFKASAQAMARTLNNDGISTEILSGDTANKDRQPMVDRFQDGTTKVLVCMFGAGGVGITLTAAQDVILHDRPWTPGDAVQAEDRCHRIGQQSSVMAYWIQLQYHEIDAKIDNILLKKQSRIDLVLEGKRKTMRGIPSIESMAIEIMDAIMQDKEIDVSLEDSDDIPTGPPYDYHYDKTYGRYVP